ncbi:hypothetical protein NKJ23_15920 [Mesorhizobium sp. M0184]|uniref:hypothetical protein n=1 Tax=Mesorhizobium sp. M0184 TaxID=2956906 RepID=UPI003335CA46
MTGYDEQTMTNAQRGFEVYGADGHGWYGYAKDVSEWLPRNVTVKPSLNPLFVYFVGMNAAKLRKLGFI